MYGHSEDILDHLDLADRSHQGLCRNGVSAEQEYFHALEEWENRITVELDDEPDRPFVSILIVRENVPVGKTGWASVPKEYRVISACTSPRKTQAIITQQETQQ